MVLEFDVNEEGVADNRLEDGGGDLWRSYNYKTQINRKCGYCSLSKNNGRLCGP